MLRSLCTGTCALALIAPTAASAQRGGGFHGGGFHGGGFHGGGFHGGGFHGGGFHGEGFHHGWGGYGGYRGWYGGGWGWPGYWPGYWGGLGLGLGLGGSWTYDAYEPWSYYYPPSLYGAGDESGGMAPPEPAAVDPWMQESAAEAGAPSPGPNGAACGRWSWQADQSRYSWNTAGCPATPSVK